MTEVNDSPTAVNDSTSVAEDGSVVTSVLANDLKGPANEAGQTLSVSAVSQGAHGTVTTNGTTTTYSPAADYNGPDSFTYTITDDGTTNGLADPRSSTATVSVTVTEVNDSPTAVDDSASVAEDGSVITIDPRTNDIRGPANEAGQTLSVTAVSQGAHGSVELHRQRRDLHAGRRTTTAPTASATPITDDGTTNGVADPKTSTATVSVTVTEVNDTPDRQRRTRRRPTRTTRSTSTSWPTTAPARPRSRPPRPSRSAV